MRPLLLFQVVRGQRGRPREHMEVKILLFLAKLGDVHTGRAEHRLNATHNDLEQWPKLRGRLGREG